MIIEDVYANANPQLMQIIAGNFNLFFLLPGFGEYYPDKLCTRDLENRYFNEGITEMKCPPICSLNWPCKFLHIEALAGEVFVDIRLILSSKNSLKSHSAISTHISEEYYDLERNFFNRGDADSILVPEESPKYKRIPYPKSQHQVARKGVKFPYFQAQAGSHLGGITPIVNYAPAGEGVAIKFDFRFNGFTAENPTELAARDALLEQICDDFMSHVEISPLPRDERPTTKTPSIDNTNEDDGW
ncbi:hypothetical protein QWY82_05865 [Simiduia curdlanivorans]|uniref:Uncharacterized protein n=1 Tax=Simiduia curdlanivorans TaxID=1492769 RepID=A0ABV8V369_9GAMM|nr:hypothetical protein [Simiduia curdlanivorans]MDN3638338.1 hypothetical protein [Simiduia curdlanivorans]